MLYLINVGATYQRTTQTLIPDRLIAIYPLAYLKKTFETLAF